MCGIVGFTGQPNRAVLRRMCRTLVHRGPDDEGYYLDPPISLGMRRLAVVDVPTGRQPLANENGNVWVVFNGEIYNHQELRRELEKAGHRFRSHHSDTEVIVHLYEERGERWVERCNGMFGVAIWDAAQHKLLLYRDRIGKKPLYYVVKEGQVYFASEIKALLSHPLVSRTPDWRALYDYFGAKHIAAPRTAFREVRQLLPGQYLVWEKGRVRLHRYWRVDFSRRLNIDQREAAQRLLDLLDDAIRLRMDCDVPYGAYLSGGLDSSSVVSLMCRRQSTPVRTFSLVYEDPLSGKSEDRASARKMARRLGTEHHEYLMKADELPETLPRVLRAFDEPFSGVISTYYLSTLIHRHVKVALSGDGADELFGSYLSHRLAGPMQYYLRLVEAGRADESTWTEADRAALGEFSQGDKLALLRRVAHPDPRCWRRRLQVFEPAQRRELLTADFLDRVGEEADGERPADEPTARDDPLNACLEADQNDLLPNQVLAFVDRLSMAHSIEVRVPFLDYRLIEFASALPGHYKINGPVSKLILKQAVQGLLPPEVVHRPKEGFVLPVYTWMRSRLRPYVEATLAPERVRRYGLLRPEAVDRLLKAHYDGAADLSAQIWNLVCFQVWCETCLAA